MVKPLERVNETRRQMNVDTEAEDPDGDIRMFFFSFLLMCCLLLIDKQNTNETKKVQVFHFRKFLEVNIKMNF